MTINAPELDRWITGNHGVDGEVHRKCQSCGGPMLGVADIICPRCRERDNYEPETIDENNMA